MNKFDNPIVLKMKILIKWFIKRPNHYFIYFHNINAVFYNVNWNICVVNKEYECRFQFERQENSDFY